MSVNQTKNRVDCITACPSLWLEIVCVFVLGKPSFSYLIYIDLSNLS